MYKAVKLLKENWGLNQPVLSQLFPINNNFAINENLLKYCLHQQQYKFHATNYKQQNVTLRELFLLRKNTILA